MNSEKSPLNATGCLFSAGRFSLTSFGTSRPKKCNLVWAKMGTASMELLALLTRRFVARPARVVMLVMAFPSTSFAFVVTAEQRAACAPDVYRLCSSDIPNVGKIIVCMRREKPNLSPACRAVVEAAEEAVATRSVATSEDEWCQFNTVAENQGQQDPAQQDWRKWCGAAAYTQ
jgi:hypothetical protein